MAVKKAKTGSIVDLIEEGSPLHWRVSDFIRDNTAHMSLMHEAANKYSARSAYNLRDVLKENTTTPVTKDNIKAIKYMLKVAQNNALARRRKEDELQQLAKAG